MNEIRLTGRHYLAVTLPDMVADGVEFELTVTAKNGHHDALGAAYPSAQVTLVATIDGEDVELSPEVIDLTNGTWTGNITPTFPEGADLDKAFHLDAMTVESVDLIADDYPKHEYQAEGWDEALAAEWGLVFASSPSAVTRTENFLLSVEARDSEGTLLTDVSGTVTIALTGAAEGDTLSVGTLTMTAGVASSASMMITGGTGTVSGVTLSAEMEGFDSIESDAFAVQTGAAPTATYVGLGRFLAHDSYFDTGQPGWSSEWAAAQAGALADLRADSTVESYTGASHDVTNRYNYLSVTAWRGCGYRQWTISNEQKLSIKGARIKACTLYGAVKNYYDVGYAWYDPGHAITFSFTESAPESGAALIDLADHASISIGSGNAMHQAAGGTPTSPGSITIDLGSALVNFIKNMSGNDLFINATVSGGYHPTRSYVFPNDVGVREGAALGTTLEITV